VLAKKPIEKMEKGNPQLAAFARELMKQALAFGAPCVDGKIGFVGPDDEIDPEEWVPFIIVRVAKLGSDGSV
jgi:hypothetical protein